MVGTLDFSDELRRHLQRLGISQNRAGPLLGCAGPFVNQLIRRVRTPPIDSLERWADALGLEGADRTRFIIAGHLAHASPLIRSLVAEQGRLLMAAGVKETIHIDGLTNKNSKVQDELDDAAQSLIAALERDADGEQNKPGTQGDTGRTKAPRIGAGRDHALP